MRSASEPWIGTDAPADASHQSQRAARRAKRRKLQASKLVEQPGHPGSKDQVPEEHSGSACASASSPAGTAALDSDIEGADGHASSPSTPHSRQRGRPVQNQSDTRQDERSRYFGLPRHNMSSGRGGVADYKEMYPNDALGEEMGENARVWRVYLDESGRFDDDMLREYMDSLDVHFIFAALFSAVVTTFVVQTSQVFQPDYGRISAAILLELVALRRATSSDEVPPAGVNLESMFFTSTDVWVNVLWFITLALSLGTVLIAAVVKQWLLEYIRTPPGPPRDRALIRHNRYMAFLRWKVPLIVGLIPLLLHISLALFLAGLSVFLYGLSSPASSFVLAVTALTYGCYIATQALAVAHWECSYRTPTTHALRSLLRALLIAYNASLDVHGMYHAFRAWATRIGDHLSPRQTVQDLRHQLSDNISAQIMSWRNTDLHMQLPQSAGVAEINKISTSNLTPDMMRDSLQWLSMNSANPSANDIVVEAFAGKHILDPHTKLAPQVWHASLLNPPPFTINQPSPAASRWLEEILQLADYVSGPLKGSHEGSLTEYPDAVTLRVACSCHQLIRKSLMHYICLAVKSNGQWVQTSQLTVLLNHLKRADRRPPSWLKGIFSRQAIKDSQLFANIIQAARVEVETNRAEIFSAAVQTVYTFTTQQVDSIFALGKAMRAIDGLDADLLSLELTNMERLLNLSTMIASRTGNVDLLITAAKLCRRYSLLDRARILQSKGVRLCTGFVITYICAVLEFPKSSSGRELGVREALEAQLVDVEANLKWIASICDQCSSTSSNFVGALHTLYERTTKNGLWDEALKSSLPPGTVTRHGTAMTDMESSFAEAMGVHVSLISLPDSATLTYAKKLRLKRQSRLADNETRLAGRAWDKALAWLTSWQRGRTTTTDTKPEQGIETSDGGGSGAHANAAASPSTASMV